MNLPVVLGGEHVGAESAPQTLDLDMHGLDMTDHLDSVLGHLGTDFADLTLGAREFLVAGVDAAFLLAAPPADTGGLTAASCK